MSITAALLSSNVQPLIIESDVQSVYGFVYGVGTAETGSVTVSVLSGSPAYTYSWAYLSGDVVFSCSTASSATTTFTVPMSYGQANVAVWRCTVTDSLSTVATVDINVSAFEFSYD